MDMAFKSALSVFSRRIGQAVRKAADGFGLVPGHYALLGTYDEDSDRFTLTFRSDHPIDEKMVYSAILDEIRAAFPEFPHFAYHITLVIRTVQDLNELSFESLGGEQELDLSEMFARA